MRLALIFLAAVALLPAQHEQARGEDTPPELSAESLYIGDKEAIAAGKELYMSVCSGCHGVNGEGGRGPSLIEGRGVRRASNEQLFNIIKLGIPGSDMPPSPFEDAKVWQLTAYVRNLSAPAVQQFVPGDPTAGKALFFGKAGCTECHMIRGEGGFLGPDLTNAGFANNYQQLREAILEPNKRLTEGYRPVVVKLKDGTTIRGVAKNHSNYTLQALDDQGKLHLLNMRDVAETQFLKDSWMPDDYQDRLSPEELDDLLAFVSRQSVRPPQPAGSKPNRRRSR